MSSYNIENECENEYSAQFARATYTPLDMYCRPDGKEVDAEDDLCKDFHFPDLDNFLENIEQMTGVCPEALEVELVEGERGVVCVSYRSNGEGMYEKDEPTCMWHIYYRISAPASNDALGCLLGGKNCTELDLSVEHIILTAVPLDGLGASPELLDNDLSEFDLDSVDDLEDLKIMAGGCYLEDARNVDAIAVPEVQGALRLDYNGDSGGFAMEKNATHRCSMFVRIMEALGMEELERLFPLDD